MTPHILLVDDNRDSCDLAAMRLGASGYVTDTANDGATALKLASQNHYDLAIIDFQMPGMNGVDLFRQMHAQHPEIVGIFLTGFTTIDVVFPAIDAGIMRVLPKPVDFSELMPLIEEYVGEPD